MEVENHSINMADKDKDTDKDNEEEEEEEEVKQEEKVTNLLPTTANTAYIHHPLSGSTTVEEEVEATAPTPSVKRATAPTPNTALTLATRSMRTSTTEGLRETRAGKRGYILALPWTMATLPTTTTTIYVANVGRTILAISSFGVGLQ
jgi:hypothetical protein